MGTGYTMFLVVIGVTLLSLLFLLFSVDTIEPLEFGITYNKITKSIGKEVYPNGRYIIGPWNTFVKYPSNLVTVEFSDSKAAQGGPLQTRTAEGLTLTLHVSFQFQINKGDIPNLYNLANINYEGTIIRISRDVILKVAGMYNASDYWKDRQKIGEFMRQQLDLELHKAYTSCLSLQLMRIDLPKTFEDSIVATQVEVQKTNMRKFEQMAELIRQNISVIVSEADQKIQIINSTAYAEAYRIKKYATAQALNNTIITEAEVYQDLENNLNLFGNNLTEFLVVNSLLERKKAKVLVGLQNSIINLNNMPSDNLK